MSAQTLECWSSDARLEAMIATLNALGHTKQIENEGAGGWGGVAREQARIDDQAGSGDRLQALSGQQDRLRSMMIAILHVRQIGAFVNYSTTP